MGIGVVEDVVHALQEFLFQLGIAEFLGDLFDNFGAFGKVKENDAVRQTLGVAGFDDDTEVFAGVRDKDAIDGVGAKGRWDYSQSDELEHIDGNRARM